MSVTYAILGILSYKSYTGYDLKKIMSASSIMYWSGNNNQIYNALTGLLKDGAVTSEVIHQDDGPTKKRYTITAKGRTGLRDWIISSGAGTEIFRKPFLVQLLFAGGLEEEEVMELAGQYEQDVKAQLCMAKEEKRRGYLRPEKNEREILLWDMVYDNLIRNWESELSWVSDLKERLKRGENRDEME